jgi:plastocyanin
MKYLRARQLFHWPLAGMLLVAGCSGPQPSLPSSPSATPAAPAPTPAAAGTIRGVVHLKGKSPAPASEKISQDQTTCGSSVSLPRIVLGKENGIKDTFVYLAGAPVAGPPAAAAASVLVDQKKCQYVPHALTVPVGSALDITNSDSILHNVHGNVIGSEGMETLFNIAQPIQGQRGKTPVLDKPGIVMLTCEAGHPWMNAYVLVAGNPYAAVTNDDGAFVIPNVPAGSYPIKLWHEGVTLKQNNKSLQRYDYEDPYEITKNVVVTAGGETVVNFDLALRPGK